MLLLTATDIPHIQHQPFKRKITKRQTVIAMHTCQNLQPKYSHSDKDDGDYFQDLEPLNCQYWFCLIFFLSEWLNGNGKLFFFLAEISDHKILLKSELLVTNLSRFQPSKHIAYIWLFVIFHKLLKMASRKPCNPLKRCKPLVLWQPIKAQRCMWVSYHLHAIILPLNFIDTQHDRT